MTRREDRRVWSSFTTVILIMLAAVICAEIFNSWLGNLFGSSFGYISLTAVSWLSSRRKDRLFQKKTTELYKFAEFGKLSAGIFHDIANPLTSISLVVEKLKSEGVTSQSIEDIEVAIAASKRMGSFMGIARKHLRSGDGKCFFSIEKEAKEAMCLLEYRARLLHVDIKTEFEEDLKIYGDPVKFFQIMENLISNAVDSYTRSNRDRARRYGVIIAAIRKEKSIEVSVEDRGCGIPRCLQSMVFKPFFTTKSGRDGIGMGLSITRAIVSRDFNGKITLKSKLKKGSTFTIIIPVQKAMY